MWSAFLMTPASTQTVRNYIVKCTPKLVELSIQGPTYCSVNCWKKELTNCNIKITTYEVPWKIYFIRKWLALYDPSMHFRQTQRSNYLKFKALLNHSFFQNQGNQIRNTLYQTKLISFISLIIHHYYYCQW